MDDSHALFADEGEAEGKAITLIRSVPRSEQPEQDPGAFGRKASVAWRTTKRAALALALVAAIGAYPFMTVRAHSIPDKPAVLEESLKAWNAPTLGLASVLVSRELDGAGWIGDYADWRPEARLTAMPAWQEGLASALSDYARLRASQAEWDGLPDKDLMMAARLLVPREDAPMKARLPAAQEAMARYDGRLMNDLAVLPQGDAPLLASLGLMEGWAGTSMDALGTASDTPDALLARRAATEAWGAARGRAQAARTLLTGLRMENPDIIEDPTVYPAYEAALAAWTKLAEMDVLVVTNARPGALPGSSVLQAGFLAARAQDATAALEAAVTARPAPVVVPAASDAESVSASGPADALAAAEAIPAKDELAAPSRKPEQSAG